MMLNLQDYSDSEQPDRGEFHSTKKKEIIDSL